MKKTANGSLLKFEIFFYYRADNEGLYNERMEQISAPPQTLMQALVYLRTNYPNYVVSRMFSAALNSLIASGTVICLTADN